MTQETEKLARFIVNTEFPRIPQALVKISKEAFLDFLGVTLAGSKLEKSAELVSGYVKEIGGNAESTVIGQGFKTSSQMAALVNGTMSHSLDFDDVYPGQTLIQAHPSVPLIPCILALGEKFNSSGQEVLAAYVIGFEVESRIGSIFTSKLVSSGWHTTPIIGTIGATAAASKLLRLDTEQTRNALGIAASFSSGLLHNFGTMTKPLHAGHAAQSGVVSGLLAKRGFTASKDIFDSPDNFFKSFHSSLDVDIQRLSSGLGTTWLMSRGISFKPYPSCRATHAGIDAVFELTQKHRINVDNISEIICRVSKIVYDLLFYHYPKTGTQAKFSLEYCISIALLEQQVLLKHFTSKKVLDSKIQHLMSKVRVEPSPDLENTLDIGNRLLIKLVDGTEYFQEVLSPKGEPENPMTIDEMIAKFTDCAGYVLSASDIERGSQMVLNLDSISKINELMDICR